MGWSDVIATTSYRFAFGQPFFSLTPGPSASVSFRKIAFAKTLYRDCLARYGTERWVADEPIVELAETDLPVWMREGVEEVA